MRRAFVDTNVFSSRNMQRDGNIDNQYWFNKTIEEKLIASIAMIEAAYTTTNFIHQKIDKKIFFTRKRGS
ncbi:hypothetical protein [Sediminibacterium sp.]|uniref:hypothetical protein n=1 Tax=Sediminibacterium sp. TaxID=1917865 RepID=UPI003F70BD12